MDDDSNPNGTLKKSEQSSTTPVMNTIDGNESHKKSSCSICGKTFSSNSSLNRHMKQHSGIKPYACSFNCGKTFSTLYNCKRHEMQHTTEAPFRCDVEGCFRCFKSLSALNYHRKTHSNEKPFVCSVEDCHKAFQSRSNLVKHMLTHSSECSFFCPFCQHQYKRKSDMERHVRKKHQPTSDVSPSKDEQFSSLMDQNRKQAEIIGFLLERNKQLQDRLNSSNISV